MVVLIWVCSDVSCVLVDLIWFFVVWIRLMRLAVFGVCRLVLFELLVLVVKP